MGHIIYGFPAYQTNKQAIFLFPKILRKMQGKVKGKKSFRENWNRVKYEVLIIFIEQSKHILFGLTHQDKD